jgi:DNA (cytosine-5)-methyltransferase 1
MRYYSIKIVLYFVTIKTNEVALKVASFFAGIGGFDLGLERSGMEVVFQCEINKFGQSILKKHWPEVKLISDIKNVDASDIPRNTNLWCGGFPCQDLSIANQGKRKGLDGERSGLFYEFARLVKKRKPKWIILENVPGLLNSHQGQDFKYVLEELDELGYGVSWRILDAKYFGTPQRRRRVYIVGSLGSLSSARVLFEEGSTRIVAKSGTGEKTPRASLSKKSNEESNFFAIQHASIGRKASAGPQAKGYRNDGETYTLDSRGSADAVCSTASAFRVRKASGIPTKLDSHRYRAIGNAVNVSVIEWIGRRIMAVESE